MAGKPTLHGAGYSVNVRIARLAPIEKGVDHGLIEVDVFAKGSPPDWYRALFLPLAQWRETTRERASFAATEPQGRS